MKIPSPVQAWFRPVAAILVVLVTYFGFLYGVGTLVNLITKKYSEPAPPVKSEPVKSPVNKNDEQPPVTQTVNCVYLFGGTAGINRVWRTNQSANVIYDSSTFNTGKFRFTTTDGKAILVSGQVVVEPCEK